MKEVSVLDKLAPRATEVRPDDDGAPRRRRRMNLARIDHAAPLLSIAATWNELR